jgi:hypothetical protein
MSDVENPEAFARPISHDGTDCTAEVFPAQEGMTLRDYFAGQALAGMLANRYASWHDKQGNSRIAYKCADAMLATRKGSGQ